MSFTTSYGEFCILFGWLFLLEDLRYPETHCAGVAKLQLMDQIWPTAYFCMAYKLRLKKKKKLFRGFEKPNQTKRICSGDHIYPIRPKLFITWPFFLECPRQLSGKESACWCRRCRRWGFDPWVGQSHGQRSLVGYSPWGCKELDTTEY